LKQVNARPSKPSYPRFISFELGLTVASLLGAYFGANYLYPLAPGVFATIASLLPLPTFLTLTAYGVAYVTVASLIWLVSNSVLFLAGKRKL
jgi:hypothetical protein